MSKLNSRLALSARVGIAGVWAAASGGEDAGVATGTGDAIEASRLLRGLYPQVIPCLTQFAQCGLCSSHF
jgi:hypothetical protein